MAGDWIVWEKGLPKKREVLAIAAALGLDRRVVACLCMEIWEWADSETADGCISGMDLSSIDAIASIPGFGAEMAAVGWVLSDREGLVFPNWDRKNTKSAKHRLQESERKRQARKGVM